jgi:hypothetical protein
LGSPNPALTIGASMTEFSPDTFSSDLTQASERFLSRLLQHAFEDEWRTPEEFLEAFPPKDIIEALRNADELRVSLLVGATGVHEKIARKKSLASAAEDLELALAEKMVEPKQLLAEFPSDERVRYLDAVRLWQFVTDGDFFEATRGDGKRFERAVARITFTIDLAIAEELLTLQDVTDGIGFEALAKALPISLLQKVVRQALESGRLGTAFDEEQLLNVVSLKDLVGHLKLEDAWTQVVMEKVADPAGFLDAPIEGKSKNKKRLESVVPNAPPGIDAISNGTKKASSPPADFAPNGAKKAVPKGDQPKPKEKAVPASPISPAGAATTSTGGSGLLTASPSTPPPASSVEDEEARETVATELRTIKRLPPNYKEIPVAALCSIESMYADLAGVEDEDERLDVIEEAFPSEAMLRVAMLGLVRLLDPSVDVDDPVIRDADVAALVKIVLFEEKRRRGENPSSPLAADAPEDIEVEELPT